MGKISEALEKSSQWKNESETPADSKQRRETLNRESKPHRTEPLISAHSPSPVAIEQAQVESAFDATPRHRTASYRSDRIDPNLVVLSKPHTYETEQFRMLRTNILFPPQGGKPRRSIMITSAAPEDGKSFVAVNLALSISQNIDKHVMLIDCDMRRPRVHTMLGYGAVPGLSDYLTTGKPLSQLLLRTVSERLTILPGGQTPPNPAELLTSNRMAALLQEVTKRYSDRFIIIDSPPPHLTAESNALARLVDGVILVVRIGSSSKKSTSELVQKIGPPNIIGVVCNSVGNRMLNYYGRGKYASYSQYYGKHDE